MLINWLSKFTGQKLIFPFYHTVSNERLPYIKYLFKTRNICQFEKDIDFLLKHFEPIDWKEIKDKVQKQIPFRKNYFLLTFDDGLKEVYTTISPVLLKKGIPSVFFINPYFIDNKAMFYRFKLSYLLTHMQENEIHKSQFNEIMKALQCHSPKMIKQGIMRLEFKKYEKINQIADILEIDFDLVLEKYKPYLTTREIKQLIKQGFSIGAHSLEHPCYKEITYNEQIKQTVESVQWVKDQFKLDYNLFSFPFSDHFLDKCIFEKIYKEADLDMSFGTAGLKNDVFPYHFQRIAMEKKKSNAQSIVLSQYTKYIAKNLLNMNTLKRD